LTRNCEPGSPVGCGEVRTASIEEFAQNVSMKTDIE
jgi:hypothetical protein